MTLSPLYSIVFTTTLLLSACGTNPKDSTHVESNAISEQECSLGETKTADDGCNTCTCTEEGWACTEMACAEPDSPGQECTLGTTKPAEDGCNTCTCDESGWSCTELGCEPNEQPTGAVSVCPAPSASAEMCAQVIVWSKAEDGKSCCRYATPCHAPKGWKQFPSEAECSN